MNIIVSYDFIDIVKGSNEPAGPIKLMKYTLKHNPVWKLYMAGSFAIDVIREPFGKALGESALGAGGAFMIASLYFLIIKRDPVKERADIKIDELSSLLQKIDVNTNSSLIKESRLEGKKYEIRLNDKKFPQIIESKFILVPSYDNNGEVKDTSLLQEHALFTKQYVLSKSRGLEKKKQVLAYSNS